MTILVTGGAGFIGSHVVDRLIDEHEVYVVDDLSSGSTENLAEGVHFHEGDIRDADFMHDLFEAVHPEIVFHFAAQINARKAVEEPMTDTQLNIVASLQLLELCREFSVKKIIFSSTGGVMYGQTEERPTPETHTPHPITPYAISKLTTDHHLHFYYEVYGMPYVSLRFGNVYGPRQNPHGEAGVVAIFTERMLEGQEATINGTGETTRDYVYVADIADACYKAMTHMEVVGVFNVGTGTETSVNTIYKLIQAQHDSEWVAQHGPAKPEQKNSSLDSSKIREQMGWMPKVTLEEGITKTVEWYKEAGTL